MGFGVLAMKSFVISLTSQFCSWHHNLFRGYELIEPPSYNHGWLFGGGSTNKKRHWVASGGVFKITRGRSHNSIVAATKLVVAAKRALAMAKCTFVTANTDLWLQTQDLLWQLYFCCRKQQGQQELCNAKIASCLWSDKLIFAAANQQTCGYKM